MSTTPTPMPNPITHPEEFYAWAITPEGEEHFRKLNEAMIEAQKESGQGSAVVKIEMPGERQQ